MAIIMNNTTTNALETQGKAPATLFASAITRVAIRATAPTLVATLSAVAVAVVFIVSSTTLRPNAFDPVGERSLLERYAVQIDGPENDAGRDVLFVVEPQSGETISQEALDALYAKIEACELLEPKLFGFQYDEYEREPARFLSADELQAAAQLAVVAAKLARNDSKPLELKTIVAQLAQSQDVDARFAFAKAFDDVMRLPNPTHENIARPVPDGVEAREPQAFQTAKFLIAKDGALAGSMLRMNHALRNVVEVTGLPVEDVIQTTSWNQAEELGLGDQFGRIEPDYVADLVVLGKDDYEVKAVFVGGEKRV